MAIYECDEIESNERPEGSVIVHGAAAGGVFITVIDKAGKTAKAHLDADVCGELVDAINERKSS